MVGIDRTAQGYHNLLGLGETVHQLATDAFEAGGIYGSAGSCRVEALRFDAEDFLCILFVAEDKVATRDQFRHDFGGSLAVFPEVLPIIQVARYGDSHPFGGVYRLPTYLGGSLTDSWRDTSPMKPVCPLENSFPVYHARLNLGYGGMGTVVYHFARTGYGSGLKEIDSHSFASTDDVVGLYSVAVQIRQTCFSNIILREAGYILNLHPIMCQGHGDIGFSSAIRSCQFLGLPETKVSGRGKAQHDLAECYDFLHGIY